LSSSSPPVSALAWRRHLRHRQSRRRGHSPLREQPLCHRRAARHRPCIAATWHLRRCRAQTTR